MRVNSVNDQGDAFERWVFDILRPYLDRLNSTPSNGNPDLYFTKGERNVLLECKCFSYRRNDRTNHRPNYLILRPSQINALKRMKNSLNGQNEIYIVVGILFGGYDLLPVVIEFERALSKAKRWKDAKGRKYISMEVLVNEMTLRQWMSEMFGVKAEHIQYPEFRSYLR